MHERYIDGCLLHARPPLTGDLAYNPGMCPDWELNQQPFNLQACTQSSEPHEPGHHLNFVGHSSGHSGEFSLENFRTGDFLKRSTNLGYEIKPHSDPAIPLLEIYPKITKTLC